VSRSDPDMCERPDFDMRASASASSSASVNASASPSVECECRVSVVIADHISKFPEAWRPPRARH
jgi:hypothetical protein